MENKGNSNAMDIIGTTIVLAYGTSRLFREKIFFLQLVDCTRLLDGIEKKLGCLNLRWSTTDQIDHSMSGEDN